MQKRIREMWQSLLPPENYDITTFSTEQEPMEDIIKKNLDKFINLNLLLKEISIFISEWESIEFKLNKIEDNTDIEFKETRKLMQELKKDIIKLQL